MVEDEKKPVKEGKVATGHVLQEFSHILTLESLYRN
jgi:hypothetical protein